MLTKLGEYDLNKTLHRHIVDHLKWPFDAGPERIRYLALCMAGEAGELANLVKKEWRGDKLDHDEWLAKLKSELSDVGNYAFMLAEALGVDLPQAMLDKLIEVEQRPTWKGGPPS